MEKCKFCLAEIEDGLTRCPCCGKDLTEKEPLQEPEMPVEEAPAEESAVEETPVEEVPAKKKASAGKIAVAVAVIVVLVAVLAALILVRTNAVAKVENSEEANVESVEETVPATTPADGEPGTAREKGTYTVSDEEMLANQDTVVATMGDKTLTNGQLQVYYWMGYHNFLTSNYSYAQYFGLDMSQPLDVQIMNAALHGEDYSQTWQQYFLQFALNSWQQVQAVAIAAEDAGLEMEIEDQERLDNLEATLKEAIAQYDVTMEEYLAMNFGSGAGLEEYRHYQEVYYRGAPYYAQETMKMMPSDQDLEQYFADHEEEYTSGGITKDLTLNDVRHILVKPEGGTLDEATGQTSYSEVEMAAAKEEAEAILETWKQGEATEESFSALAAEKSDDTGSAVDGGLIDGIHPGSSLVENFLNWSIDANRKKGDTGIVESVYGYHVMYFVESHEDIWKGYVKNDWLTEKSNAMLEELIAEHPMDVSYDKIVLGQLMPQK